MKTNAKKVTLLMLAILMLLLFVVVVAATAQQNVAYAAEEETTQTAIEIAQEKTKQIKGWTAAIVIAVVAATGAVCMGLAIIKAIDGITRQPEADGKIRTALILGLVFIETTVIYALIVAILLVFIL